MKKLLFLSIFLSQAISNAYSQVPTNGLVAYYPFNGNANDESSNNDGVVNGATLTTDRFGNSGKAYSFDGDGDYINLGINLPDFGGVNPFTISLWVNKLSNEEVIFLSRFNRNVIGEFIFGYTSLFGSSSPHIPDFKNNSVWFHREIPPWGVQSNNSIENSNWEHLTIEYDGNTSKIFINGILNKTAQTGFSNSTGNSTPVIVGGWFVNNLIDARYNGKLDDIRIYNRALSNTEVQALYQAEAPPIDITTGLVAHYKMDGNAQDASGNSNHGTPQNGVTFGTDRFGNAGKAASFDGVDDYVQATSPQSLTTITTSFWFKPSNLNIQTPICIGIDDGIGGSPTLNGISLFVPSNDVKIISSDQQAIQTGYTFPSSNQWYFVSIKQIEGQYKMFINNSLVFTGNGAIPRPATQIRIGSATNVRFFNGLMDDIRIYNRALSDTEIQALYQAEAPPIDISTGLVAHYKFEDNFLDETDNNNVGIGYGTVNGGPSFIQNGTLDKFANFDGVDDYIEVNHSSSLNNYLNTGELTISYWVKPENGPTRDIIAKRPQTNNGGFMVQVNDYEMNYYHSLYTNGGWKYAFAQYSPNEWQHIVFTAKENGDIKTYRNGILIETVSIVGNTFIGTENNMRIGANTMSGFEHFNKGGLNHLRIYSRKLSDTEIQAIYQAEAPPIDINTGLVAHYKMDGNAQDASGNSNHGTPQNGVSFGTDRFGNAGKAAGFNGSNSIITVPNSPSIQNINSITLSAWVNSAGLAADGTIPILDKSNSSTGGQYFFRLYNNGSNSFSGTLNGQHGGLPFTGIQLGTWYQLTMISTNNVFTFYLNGQKVGSVQGSGTAFSNTMPLTLGANPSGILEVLNGKLDDIRIYNRALSDAEVLALYNSDKSGVSLTSAIRFGGGLSTLNVGTGYNLTASLKNNGGATWLGDVYLKVKDGSPLLVASNQTIASGATLNLSASFSPQTAQIGQNVSMELLTKKGSNDFIRASVVNGTVNPILVNIEAASSEPVARVPFINVDKSQYNLGETIQITGGNFEAGQSVTIDTSPTWSSASYPNIAVASDGSITGTLIIPITNVSDRNFIVIAKDTKGENARKLLSINLPDQRKPLKVIEPNTQMNFNGGIYVGAGREFLPVKWIDPLKVGNQFQYSVGGALRRVRYKIEFEANVTGTLTSLYTYDTYKTLDFIDTYNYDVPRSALTSIVNPSTQEAMGYIKITNLDEPSRFAKSELITIYLGNVDNDLKVELLWDKSTPSGNLPPVRGLVADGVSRIFVKVSKINPLSSPSIQTVQLDLIDIEGSSTDPKWLGKLMYSTVQDAPFYNTEANPANAISANNLASNSSNSYQFWYVSPDDFMIDGKAFQNTNYRTVKLRVRVLMQGSSTPIEISLPLTIVRPPLMLVHGLNGSGLGTWEDFTLQYESPFIGFSNKVDMLPGGSYEANSQIILNRDENLKNSFQGTLNMMHEKGYAANQVDYVCHSMGGDVIRYAVENFGTYFYNNVIYKSYGQGYANKVITINTPHQGSPWADLINGLVDYIPLKYKSVIAADYFAQREWDAKDAFHRTVYSFIKVQKDAILTLEGSDAVIDLQTLSGNGGKKFNSVFSLPTHAIAGDVVQGDQSVPNFDNTILNVDRWSKQFQFIYKCLDYLREFEYKAVDEEAPQYIKDFVQFIKEVKPDEFSEITKLRDDPIDQIKFVVKIQELFLLWALNNNDFLVEGDLIVGLKSQLSGLPKTSSNVSVLNNSLIDFDKFHTSITSDNQVINKVRELLNKAVNNPMLGNNQLFSSLPATYFSPVASLSKLTKKSQLLSNSLNPVVIEKRDTILLKITSPKRHSLLLAGSNIQVQVNLTDTTYLKRIRVSFQANIKSDTLQRSKFLFGFGINESFSQMEKIYATATFSKNDTIFIIQDTLSINVSHDGLINGFAVFPQNKNVQPGVTISPNFEIRYPSYLSSNVDKSKLVVSISNISTITYNPITGNLNALNKGEAVVVFTYDGIFKDTMYVAVGGGGLPYPQTITTNALSNSSVCTGQTIQVPFTTTGGTFDVGNLFLVQISDKDGDNYNTLESEGTVSPLSIKIPNDIEPAAGYKIRVVSTNVPVIGTASATNLTITSFGTPPTVSASKTSFWSGENVTLTAANCPVGQTLKWSDGQTSNSILITPIESVVYTAVCTNGTCETQNSQPIFISKNYCPVDYVKSTNSTSGNNVYKASQSIEATHKITGNGTREQLEAPATLLKPGFETQLGVIFNVQVGGCEN